MEAARRGFLTGAVAFLAAPAIVRASNLMPVSVISPFTLNPPNVWMAPEEPTEPWRAVYFETFQESPDRNLLPNWWRRAPGSEGFLLKTPYQDHTGIIPRYVEVQEQKVPRDVLRKSHWGLITVSAT